MEPERLPRAVEVAANIVSSHVNRTETRAQDLPSLLASVYTAVKDLVSRETLSPRVEPPVQSTAPVRAPDREIAVHDGGAPDGAAPDGTSVIADSTDNDRAVPDDRTSGFVRDGRRTVAGDRLLCLDDGREVTFLGRHLRAIGTTEEDYRRRWSLPDDYPMTALSYVNGRREAARRLGLGTRIRPTLKPAQVPTSRRRSGTLGVAFG